MSEGKPPQKKQNKKKTKNYLLLTNELPANNCIPDRVHLTMIKMFFRKRLSFFCDVPQPVSGLSGARYFSVERIGLEAKYK